MWIPGPLAHQQAGIGPCRIARLRHLTYPKRVPHHRTDHALALLLPVGGSYSSFSFPRPDSPTSAVLSAELFWLYWAGLSGLPSRHPMVEGLIPANGSVSEYWAGASLAFPFGCFGGGAGFVWVVVMTLWKHWLRDAWAASDGVGGIIWLADLCKTSWTILWLHSSICFCISYSICIANCWVKPGRGVSSTLQV